MTPLSPGHRREWLGGGFQVFGVLAEKPLVRDGGRPIQQQRPAFHSYGEQRWQKPGKQAPQEGSDGQRSWQTVPRQCKRASEKWRGAADVPHFTDASQSSWWNPRPPSSWPSEAFQEEVLWFLFLFPIRAWGSGKKEGSTHSQRWCFSLLFKNSASLPFAKAEAGPLLRLEFIKASNMINNLYTWRVIQKIRNKS